MSAADHERQELLTRTTSTARGRADPDADRDATPLPQFWISGDANIAPIDWRLGALGIVLGLS
jgi:hypothetical protein